MNVKTKASGTDPALSDKRFYAIARALADPRRFAILQQIAATDGITCSALDEYAAVSPATISHHLKELHQAGLITMKREGRCANLSLRRPVFAAYLERLTSL